MSHFQDPIHSIHIILYVLFWDFSAEINCAILKTLCTLWYNHPIFYNPMWATTELHDKLTFHSHRCPWMSPHIHHILVSHSLPCYGCLVNRCTDSPQAGSERVSWLWSVRPILPLPLHLGWSESKCIPCPPVTVQLKIATRLGSHGRRNYSKVTDDTKPSADIG